jgi:hypothetical protein
MNDKPHMFIAGLHKSGTSLLHDILRSHPAISGFSNTGVPEDEGQHLQSVFRPAKAFGGPGRFGFNPESYMDEKHPLATRANADRLRDEWGRHWDRSKDVLLEKSPPNLVRTRFLQSLFPASSFVVVLRHPIVIALATQKWSRTSIPDLLEHSLTCFERFFDDWPRLNRVFVLRYEDLVQDPRGQIESLVGWAGLEMHEFNIAVRNDNEKYLSIWSAQRNAIASSITTFEMAQYESRMNIYGYSLDAPMTVNVAATKWVRNDSLQVRRP